MHQWGHLSLSGPNFPSKFWKQCNVLLHTCQCFKSIQRGYLLCVFSLASVWVHHAYQKCRLGTNIAKCNDYVMTLMPIFVYQFLYNEYPQSTSHFFMFSPHHGVHIQLSIRLLCPWSSLSLQHLRFFLLKSSLSHLIFLSYEHREKFNTKAFTNSLHVMFLFTEFYVYLGCHGFIIFSEQLLKVIWNYSNAHSTSAALLLIHKAGQNQKSSCFYLPVTDKWLSPVFNSLWMIFLALSSFLFQYECILYLHSLWQIFLVLCQHSFPDVLSTCILSE